MLIIKIGAGRKQQRRRQIVCVLSSPSSCVEHQGAIWRIAEE